MKNPWMSAWLSAANSINGAVRNQMLAEFSKTQSRVIKDWQNAWVQTWIEIWFPNNKRKSR